MVVLNILNTMWCPSSKYGKLGILKLTIRRLMNVVPRSTMSTNGETEN